MEQELGARIEDLGGRAGVWASGRKSRGPRHSREGACPRAPRKCSHRIEEQAHAGTRSLPWPVDPCATRRTAHTPTRPRCSTWNIHRVASCLRT
jgi:hypothetical protein